MPKSLAKSERHDKERNVISLSWSG